MDEEKELLRIGGKRGNAKLFILCGDLEDCAVMNIACGDFVLLSVARNDAALGLMACSVDRHRWILALDCAAIRVGPRKFAFAFPEFFYCLSLPPGCFDHEVDRFERALQRVSCYCNHAGNRDSDFSPRFPGYNFWVTAYPKIFTLSSQLLPQPVPRCAILDAYNSSRKCHTATDIALDMLKSIPDLSTFIVVPPVSYYLYSLRFPSISVIVDVAEVLGLEDGEELSQERKSGSWILALGRSSCWTMSDEGLERILQEVASWRSAGEEDEDVGEVGSSEEIGSSLAQRGSSHQREDSGR